MKTSFSKLVPYAVFGLTNVLGWTSLLATWWFFYAGPFDLLDLSMGNNVALAWDTLLCLAFFVQHSGMVRKSFRRWLERVVSPHYHGALYTIASGVALLALVVLWQDSTRILVSFQGTFRYLLRGVFFLSIAGMAWGVRALGSFDAFGLNPLRDYIRGTRSPAIPFTVRGPYLWVRHPLYLFCLMSIWSCPDLTLDRLLFNTLWTFWIVIGSILEERDLFGDFGDTYRDYQHKVPMLIPYRFPYRLQRENKLRGPRS